jgi:hypothetical protein
MKPNSPTTQKTPGNDLSNPNDDGCVLGTAGRDEDPNATTDWDTEIDPMGNAQAAEDARGLPGYPSDPEVDEAPPASSPERANEKIK